MRSSRVSSMATMRSSSGNNSMSAFNSVVLPDPVPPETRMFRRVCSIFSAASFTFLGSAPCATRSAAENDRLTKAPNGDGNFRAGRWNTDGNTRAVVQAGIDDGSRGRVQAERPGDMDGGPLKRRGGQQRGFVRVELSMSFDPDVVWAVNHDLAHVRVFQNVLQAGQEGFQ